MPTRSHRPLPCTARLPAAGLALTAALGPLACASRPSHTPNMGAAAAVAQYATVRLTTDLTALSEAERGMIPLLIEAARAMDEVFWLEAYGSRDSLLAGLQDSALRRLAEINYGPWDRLGGDTAFVPGVEPKPPGARFYPAGVTKEELTAYLAAHPGQADSLTSLYTVVRRAADGGLEAVPYHVAFAEQHGRAADRLRQAAALAEDPDLKRYLELRAEALLADDYRASDVAWLDMKRNRLDVVIGPIETYEDQLLGAKASHEAFVLVKDLEWSGRLSRFAALLPELQRGLPVPAPYRRERPGTDSDLNAYDALYYAGEANAGAKTIAINLPNDESVQLEKGTRRLQLKNAMRAKFDSILVPIAGALLAPDQRARVTFDAFFTNTMLHEVAHGLGIKNLVKGGGTVRAALREHASALEEGKADILGLYLARALRARGELGQGTMEDHYVTFLAGILRSVRFGASDAHGRANMIQFSFFEERSAFTRDSAGAYRVVFDRMEAAVAELARLLLTIQGDGDYPAAGRLLAERGVVPASLRPDLDRLASLGVPVDIIFEQGPDLLRP